VVDKRKRKSFRLEDNIIVPCDNDISGKDDKEEEKNKFIEGIGLANDLGYAIAIPIAGGALIGSFLDNKFKTTPIFTLSLLTLGIILSFVNIYKIVKKNIK
jgi:ATP synthase protein I